MICDRSVLLVLTVAVVPSACAGSSACVSCAEVVITGLVVTDEGPGFKLVLVILIALFS